MNLKGRNFLTLKDFTPEEITYLLDLSAELTLILPNPNILWLNGFSRVLSIILYNLTSSSFLLRKPVQIISLSSYNLYFVNVHGNPKIILFLSCHTIFSAIFISSFITLFTILTFHLSYLLLLYQVHQIIW